MTRISKILAVAVVLLGFGAAQAQEQQTVVVERRTSTAGVIARDAVAGLILGSAVSGAIIGYEMGIEDNDDYDWEETLAWGAGIGLAAGLVWGIVDATTAETTYGRTAPAALDFARDGNSMTLDLRRRDQSGRVSFPVLRKRF